jgi:hypothetical protein
MGDELAWHYTRLLFAANFERTQISRFNMGSPSFIFLVELERFRGMDRLFYG